MLPLFLMLKPLGLINSYGGAIVPAMASVFGIFLVRQFARGIPTTCSRPRASTARASSASS
jgi:multiple sugar transport system permease protein